MIPYSISRVLFKSKSLDMRFYTKIILSDNNFKTNSLYYKIINIGDKHYCIIDTKSYININYIPKERNKTTEDSVYINDRNIYYLLTGFTDMKKKIYGDSVFYIEDDKLAIYNGNHTVKLTALGYSSMLLLKPTIIETNDREKEGVNILVNTPDRSVVLDISEFEALLYTLTKVDFFLYSQLLLNHFISSIGRNKILNENIPRYNPNENMSIYNINRTDQEKVLDIDSVLPSKKKEIDPFNLSGLN